MKKKTHEEFVQDIFNITGNEYNILETYKGNKILIKFRHNSEMCNFNEFQMKPNNFLNGQRCPVCSKKNAGKLNSVGLDSFIEKVNQKTNDEYLVVDDTYINNKTYVKLIHTACQTVFDVTPNNFLSKHSRCPLCSIQIRNGKLRMNIEDVKKSIFDVVGNEYELVSDTYINNQTKLEMKHNVCGNTFKVSIGNFIFSGTRCTYCSETKGEYAIRCFLESQNVNYKKQYTFDSLIGDSGLPLRFDFAVFDERNKLLSLIEFDGRFHFEKVHETHDLELQKKYDELKNYYCVKNKIQLIRIPYWEMENIDDILKNSLPITMTISCQA